MNNKNGQSSSKKEKERTADDKMALFQQELLEMRVLDGQTPNSPYF